MPAAFVCLAPIAGLAYSPVEIIPTRTKSNTLVHADDHRSAILKQKEQPPSPMSFFTFKKI